jgi:aldehyde dehydrogenase (NAD+)
MSDVLDFDRAQLFIGGDWVKPSTSDVIEVISPATEDVIGRVPAGQAADIDAAVAAARSTFDSGIWRSTSIAERGEFMKALAAAMWARSEELIQATTAEMGSPIAQTRMAQVPGAIMMLEYYAAMAAGLSTSERRTGVLGDWTVVREPVGVVGAIIPWNGPMYMSMYKLGPALLTGCSIVLKPPPEAPLSSYLLAEAVMESGIPAGVVNIVAADRAAGRHLVSHPGVDKVAFTGSTAAGRWIMEECAKSIKRVTLELGGKSAALVLDDADIKNAVDTVVAGVTANNGQICVANTRLIVSAKRHDDIVEAIADRFRDIQVGDPWDEATGVGPLVAERQRTRVLGYIDAGKDEGATLVEGGGRPEHLDKGWYVEPTLFANVDNGMRIAREEIFGPVLSVIKYHDEKEAVDLVNDSSYGLGAAVFSQDIQKANDIAREIRAGTVNINAHTFDFALPFGGFKQSGIGREGGPEALSNYLEFKTIGPIGK